MSGEHIVGSVRAKASAGICAIGRLVVAPDFQGRGIGSKLLQHIEASFAAAVSTYELFTGSKSEANIRLYQRHGYSVVRTQAFSPTISLTYLRKAANSPHEKPIRIPK